MPSVLSKILLPEWNLPYNCYELGHTWTPYCTAAALEIGLIVFIQSLKLYTPLYLANQTIQRKFDWKTLKDSAKSIVRSSTFLGVNAFLVIYFFCFFRHLSGRFYYTLCAYVPSFFGSLLAILTERPSRRRALAFYCANIGSETLYRILVSRGYMTPVPNGRFLLFSAAITGLVFMYESGILRDPFMRFVFQLVLGSRDKGCEAIDHDAKDREVKEHAVKCNESSSKPKEIGSETDGSGKSTCPLENDQLITKRSTWFHVTSLYDRLKGNFTVLSHRHDLCPHKEFGCAEDILYNGIVRPFLIGYSSQLALRTLPKLLTLKKGLLWDYLLNPSYLLSRQHTSFGLFLASFVALYRSSRCALRHVTGRDTPYHAALATLVSAPCQFIAPSTSVTLYLVWKCVEACFAIAAKKGFIPYDRALVNVIYALATAELFYAAVLDPKHIKPSYKRFLDRVTQNKLAFINRNVLEVFGTNSSAGYESFLPVYDLAHTTRRFQESVLVWLL